MVPGLDGPALARRQLRPAWRTWLDGLLVVLLVYLFVLALEVMGGSFKMLGGGFSRSLFALTDSPLTGLFVGILVTAIVQSSSLTTSITVVLVASGDLTLAAAVPIVMGANIGTSVTNTLVSLVHIRRKDEFRRAFAGAIVHDLFNWCTVLVFFPLEWITRALTGQGYLERVASWVEQFFVGVKPVEAFSPLAVIVKPISKLVEGLFLESMGIPRFWSGVILAVLSLLLLFFVLAVMTKILKHFVVGRLEQIIDKVLFRYALFSFLLGLITTSIVQSSSVTTSMIVPLLGAGLLTLEQVYPYTLGANVGTTVTALLAALAVMATVAPGDNAAAARAASGLTIALVHLLFNVHGSAVFYPLRFIPIRAARWYGNLAAERTRYAVFFVIGVFFVLPGAVIGGYKLVVWLLA